MIVIKKGKWNLLMKFEACVNLVKSAVVPSPSVGVRAENRSEVVPVQGTKPTLVMILVT